jgi:hypothetical protein
MMILAAGGRRNRHYWLKKNILDSFSFSSPFLSFPHLAIADRLIYCFMIFCGIAIIGSTAHSK